jgi:cobalamin biosynthesis protein CbiD
MRRSARLVEQVSAELDARAATARQLQEEAATAEALAALHKEQANAVRRVIDAELATQAKGIRRDSIWIGVVSFFGGGLLTLAVTLFVHPFH